MSKKQNCTAMSSAEAEYVALSASCAQVMWMRTQLQDYGFNYNKIPLYCDSQSAIAISCNPVQHSRTKHIHTRHKVVRLGINPMIQPEPEDLPKDNPKLEIAVLRSVINELTSGEIVSLNFIESIKEARSRVQDLTSGEIVSLNFIESIKEARSRVQDLTSGEIVSLNLLSRTRKFGHSTMELRSLISRKPALSFMRPFRCPVTILNIINHLGKFDGKADEGFFVGYSTNSKAFREFNSRTRIVKENLHVNIKDSPDAGLKPSGEEEKMYAEHLENEDKDNDVDENIVYGCIDDPNLLNLEKIVFSDDDEEVDVEADMTNLNLHILVTPTPTTRIHKDHPLEQMIGDIHPAPQTRRMTKSVTDHEPKKKVWTLVDLPYGKRAIGTKWVYINKKDKRGIVVRNKARLVAQGYIQEEGIDYEEMNVKSAFLYGKIEEEVYVCQPLGAWYETLSTYLLDNRFKGDILLVQVYVDDIIFGSTRNEMCIEFEKMMNKKFQMSSMGEFTLFLGLQVTQKDDGIFISQDKYVDEILKKFGFSTVKTASTPIETSKPLIKDENAEDVDVHLYRSMIDSLMYLTSLRPDLMFTIDDWNGLKMLRMNLGLKPVTRKVNATGHYLLLLGKKLLTTARLPLELQLLRMRVKVQDNTPSPQHTPTTASPSNIEPIPIIASSSQPQKTHKRRKTKRPTEISQSSEPTTFVTDEIVHAKRGDSMERAATIVASLDAEQDSGVNTPRSGKDRMKLNELMEICTKLSDRVLALENVNTAQDLEITSLKKRVKKLEKKKKARTPQLKRRLFKVRIESSADKSLGDQEDASKQGRNEDQDDDISWFQEDVETQGRYAHDINITTASAPITIVGVSVNIVESSTPTTTLIEDEDLIIAQTLMKMRSEKSKEKAKEKGVSSETAKRQIRGVLDEEVRLEREREEEASNATLIEECHNVQAMMDADYELATRIQAQERGELSIEERSKLFKLFDIEMKRVDTFVPMDSDVVKGSKKKAESSGKEAASKKSAGDDVAINIIRANRCFKNYKIFSEMLDDFGRHDVLDLYRLRLFDSCKVHVLLMDTGVAIHMIVEKKYPLTYEMFSRMLGRRLEVDHDSEMAFELLRFIRSQL
ncbi:putative ribonuclease H-like domain-containing protein [Tanacetum coccineum]|uniref:Ribonuclease H-like domain-containing protein n=1 Tax=Tanacetum coccineum TaxID=301880 RepID=A0ABQ5ER91_9ASTR